MTDTLSRDKKIVLNLDANILFNLSESGWFEILTIAASFPGLEIEITDLVADIEVGNRLVNRQTGETSAIGRNNQKVEILSFLDKAKRQEFKTEFADILLDPDASYALQQEWIKNKDVYQEESLIPKANMARKRSHDSLTIVATPSGVDINHQALNGMATIDIIRSEYKSRGEISIMERESLMQQDPAVRVVVTDDGLSGGKVPNYLTSLENNDKVRLTNLKGLLVALEQHFGEEINASLPTGKTFSAEAVIKDVMAVQQKKAELDGHDHRVTYEQIPTIDVSLQKKGCKTISRFNDDGEKVSEIRPVMEVLGKQDIREREPLSQNLAKLHRRIEQNGMLEAWKCDIMPEVASELLKQQQQDVPINDETKTQRYNAKHKKKPAAEKALPPGVKESEIEIDPSTIMHVNAHPVKLYTREATALEMNMQPDSKAFSEVWDTLASLPLEMGETIRLNVGIQQQETDVGIFRDKQGHVAVMVSNPQAVYQEIYGNNERIFNPELERKIPAEEPNPHHKTVKPSTIEVVQSLKPERVMVRN